MAFSLRFPAGLRALVAGVVAFAVLACLAAPAARAEGGFPAKVCAVKTGGTVWCWGMFASDPYDFAGTPRQLDGISGAQSVATAGNHGCALLTSNGVACWGENDRGQLGDGTQTGSATPVIVPGLNDARSMDVGDSKSCAARQSGEVVCWGYNDSGWLGTSSSPTLSPETVPGITDAVAVSVGAYHQCAVRVGGRVVCWGYNGNGNLGDGTSSSSTTPVEVSGLTDVVGVSVATDGACAVRAEGTVWCWGKGPIGDGTTNSSNAPVQVSGITNAVAVKAGFTSCVVLANGGVSCWGAVAIASVVSDSQVSLQPVAMPGFTDATGLLDTIPLTFCATRTGGGVSCSGGNYYAQLGNGSNPLVPAPERDVQGIENVTEIGASSAFGCGLQSSGVLRCWGVGPFGEGQTSERGISFSAASVPGGTGVESFSVGHESGCAVMADHTVKCLGLNNDGQLGDGTTDSSYLSAVAVSGLSDAVAVAVGGYAHHACAIRSGGQVVCWGRNAHGELGDGSTTNSTTPVAVSGLSDAVALAVSADLSCALRTTHTVSCWGNTPSGNSATPTDMGLTGVVDISIGEQHGCAVLDDGTAQCLGQNSSGQLGDGTTNASGTYVAVTGLTGVTQISANYGSTCALAAGEVYCWGQIGAAVRGSERDQSVPVKVAGLTGATAVETGRNTACAIKADGHATCFGLAFYPVLGDGNGPLGHGPQELPRCVIGFCTDPEEPGSGDGDGPPPVDTTPVPPSGGDQPPVVLPPKPPVGRIAVPQLRFTGRALVFSDYRVQRSGRSCPRVATVRIAVGRELVRRLKVRSKAGVCVLSATVKLPASASKLKRLRLSVTGSGVRSRNTAVNRTR